MSSCEIGVGFERAGADRSNMPPHAGEESVRLVEYSGILEGGAVVKAKPESQYSVDDFRPIKPLGNGDMGTVFLVVQRETNEPFALKVMKKEVLRVRKNTHRADNEREILSKIDHPFLPKLHFHFENDKHNFLALDYCHGGDLNVLRQKQPERRFSEGACRFYVAEVLMALEYLHSKNIVYRDLKPENILIQSGGHIMLTDFDLSLDLTDRNWTAKSPSAATGKGSMKEFVKKESRRGVNPVKSFFACGSPMALAKKPSSKNPKRRVTPEEMYRKAGSGKRSSEGPAHSFVGTEEYVAPEIVWGKGHGLPVDWWTLGVLLYELYYGRTPFKGVNRKETFYNVLCKVADFPGPRSDITDLMEQLLVKESDKRLGTAGGAEEIKKHPFFAGVNWDELHYMSRTPVVPPPFNLEEVELERQKKLEAAGKGDQLEQWSFTQNSQKTSMQARLSGPMKLKSKDGSQDQQQPDVHKVQQSMLEISISNSGECTFSGDDSATQQQRESESAETEQRRSDARTQSHSNRKEEVRLSHDEVTASEQQVFDEIF